MADEPELSIVIPVHQEAEILASAVHELCAGLDARVLDFELWLAENGSTDGTAEIAASLAESDPRVRVLSLSAPNYGAALRAGIARSRGRFVLCEEIDICDLEVLDRALPLLRGELCDLVVASKTVAGAHDERPLLRRAATQGYNAVLRGAFGFRGTDTHGVKFFHREVVAPIAARCVVEHDVFASELVIRCDLEGLRVREIPVTTREKRAPSIRLAARIPRVVRNLTRLALAIYWTPIRPTKGEARRAPTADDTPEREGI